MKHTSTKPKRRYFKTLRRWIGFDHALMNLKTWWRKIILKSISKGLGLRSENIVQHTNYSAYNLLYEMADIIENNRKLFIPKIANIDETLEELLHTERSLARFGDGEFGMMFGDLQLGFQRYDGLMIERLKEVLASQDPKLMIGLPNIFGVLGPNCRNLREMMGKFRDPINLLLHDDCLYYRAGVTRVSNHKEHFQKMKMIWENKKVVTIEGNMCRLGVGNDLFDNTGSLRRILAPAECAFSSYDRILAEAIKCEKDVLFLIALGPTATVLAYDLCKAGYRALDIGHLDICYELCLRGATRMIAIEGKYVGEASYRNPSPCTDATYLSQIVAEVKLNV